MPAGHRFEATQPDRGGEIVIRPPADDVPSLAVVASDATTEDAIAEDADAATEAGTDARSDAAPANDVAAIDDRPSE